MTPAKITTENGITSVLITLGEDYSIANKQNIEISVVQTGADVWPDFTGARVEMEFGELMLRGHAVQGTGQTRSFRFGLEANVNKQLAPLASPATNNGAPFKVVVHPVNQGSPIVVVEQGLLMFSPAAVSPVIAQPDASPVKPAAAV